MDFMHDTLENGKNVTSLNVIDDFNREILNTIDTSLPSTKVVSELKQLVDLRGKPKKDKSANGLESISEN